MDGDTQGARIRALFESATGGIAVIAPFIKTDAIIQPGLRQDEFQAAIRSPLAAIPIAETLLEASNDTTLTRADAHTYLETIAGDEFSTNDLWLAFVNWMAYFFSDHVIRQEIAEIALRRAQLLNG